MCAQGVNARRHILLQVQGGERQTLKNILNTKIFISFFIPLVCYLFFWTSKWVSCFLSGEFCSGQILQLSNFSPTPLFSHFPKFPCSWMVTYLFTLVFSTFPYCWDLQWPQDINQIITAKLLRNKDTSCCFEYEVDFLWKM